MKIEFVKSALESVDFPPEDRPEIAIVGRSNSGKSSIINAIWGSKIARTSSTPGRTQLLNFFNVGEHYRIVDTPGYGYSKGASAETYDIGFRAIENYILTRNNLVGLLLIMDVRRDWSDDEKILVDFLSESNRPWLVVANKVDKLGKSELAKRVAAIRKGAGPERVMPVSSLKKIGLEELEEKFFSEWVKSKN